MQRHLIGSRAAIDAKNNLALGIIDVDHKDLTRDCPKRLTSCPNCTSALAWHPRDNRSNLEKMLARRLEAGCKRTLNYYRLRWEVCEPQRVYGNRILNCQHIPPRMPLPIAYNHPEYPVVMRGITAIWGMNEPGRHGNRRGWRRRVLDRYLRIIKFDCFSGNEFNHKIDQLNKTCRWDDLNTVANSGGFRPRDGYGWISGKLIRYDIEARIKEKNVELESKYASLVFAFNRMQEENDKLRASVAELTRGCLSDATTTLLDDPKQKFWDNQVRGLYLQADSSGNKCWWLQRPKAGRSKKIGRFGFVSLDDAREMAHQILAGQKPVPRREVSLPHNNMSSDMESRAIAQALYEMGIIKPGELR